MLVQGRGGGHNPAMKDGFVSLQCIRGKTMKYLPIYKNGEGLHKIMGFF